MGAETSHHEPLNIGGMPPAAAPDFNRASSVQGAAPHHKSSLASKALNPRNTIRRSIRKRKERRKNKQQNNRDEQVEGPTPSPSRGMDRLRRSFRDSFRKKKDAGPEASKPHQWQHDEVAVKSANCTFPVKYLGCVEVFESRGMQVCEEALKVLRASRRRPIRGILHVSGDGLRVVDDETKGLLVDQTIEKVSFCAPDRNHERGFSYICRDGTTRRWMCHGFVAIKETGERLSHAVGCAFSACLDRKQKRDKECGVTMTFDQANNTFTRMGSFKQMSITDRLTDPQECKPNVNNGMTSPTGSKPALPHAIARPHATPLMLQRQGSCRAFHHLNQSSPFKRQLSLRLNELPSNMERQRSNSLDTNDLLETSTEDAVTSPPNGSTDSYNNNTTHQKAGGSFPRSQTSSSIIMSSIPEVADDPVSAMCQQLSQDLTLLSSTYTNQAQDTFMPVSPKISSTILVPSVEPIREEVPWNAPKEDASSSSRAEEWLKGAVPPPTNRRHPPPLGQLRSASLGPQQHWSGGAHHKQQQQQPPPPPAPPATQHLFSNATQPPQPPQPLISSRRTDLFDSDWLSLDSATPPAAPVQPSSLVNPNNPFLNSNPITKAFEVQM